MNVDRYFARIGYTGPPTATHRTLAAIHRQHMLTVPFENLDIPLGRRISLSPEALWNKMIVERRGGFCYELNTLFGHLLQALGYRVEFLSARVWNGKQWGPDKDHMALRVEADARSWLADVGFGESFLVPLRLESDLVQEGGFMLFRLLKDDDGWIMQAQRDPDQWDHGYRFTLEGHAPESFREMCNYQQTSPDTMFTQRRRLLARDRGRQGQRCRRPGDRHRRRGTAGDDAAGCSGLPRRAGGASSDPGDARRSGGDRRVGRHESPLSPHLLVTRDDAVLAV